MLNQLKQRDIDMFVRFGGCCEMFLDRGCNLLCGCECRGSDMKSMKSDDFF